MKLSAAFFVCAVLSVNPSPSLASGETIDFSWHTPYARVVIADEAGRRMGVDPGGHVSSFGMSATRFVLSEIPNSAVFQEHLADDEGGPPGNTTSWSAHIRPAPGGVYEVRLFFLTSGLEEIVIGCGSVSGTSFESTQLASHLAGIKGAVRTLRVRMDPSALAMQVERIMRAGDLENDIRVFCDRGSISNEGICRSLTAKARALDQAVARGKRTEVDGLRKAFLNELEAQAGKTIQPGALDAMRADADALGKPPSLSTSMRARGLSVTRWQGDVVTARVSVPPAIVLLVDADGRRVGVDPAAPLTPYGTGGELREIPQSSVDQQNIGSDEAGDDSGPQDVTEWQLAVPDRAPHRFTLSVTGVANGTLSVQIGYFIAGRAYDAQPAAIRFDAITASGWTQEFTIEADHDRGAFSVTQHPRPDDLVTVLGAACRIGTITPEGICRSLTGKAAVIARLAGRPARAKLRNAVRAFVNELDAQDAKHVDPLVAGPLRTMALAYAR